MTQPDQQLHGRYHIQIRQRTGLGQGRIVLCFILISSGTWTEAHLRSTQAYN